MNGGKAGGKKQAEDDERIDETMNEGRRRKQVGD